LTTSFSITICCDMCELHFLPGRPNPANAAGPVSPGNTPRHSAADL
jgi:hypothetical protein